MNQEYNFKKFTKVGSKLGNYSISFNGKSFSFGFNSGFYNKERINKYKKVILFYDENKKAVAFNFTNDEQAEGVFTVIHSNNKTTGSVTAKSFVVNNKLGREEYFGQRKPKKINDENIGELFVVELLVDKN
jgi:hypothetical protein